MNINFKNLPITNDVFAVPDQWIYKYYLKLRQELDGRNIQIKSPFTREFTPSMFLYVKQGKYVWKDHSSGKYGNALTLAKELIEQNSGVDHTWTEIKTAVLSDYLVWKQENGKFVEEPIETEHFVYDLKCNFEIRSFEDHDLYYWGQYGIYRDVLEFYNVVPLRWFQLIKEYPHHTKLYRKCALTHSYGFFENDGTLIKIYNPQAEDFKHITLKKEVLGREQLVSSKNQTIIIASSMKDLLTLVSLDLNIDVIAPMSEKTLISEKDISMLKDLYKNVLTLFDNDKTGIRAMLMYKQLYNIDFVYVPHHKDISDFAKYEIDKLYVKHEIVRAINKKLINGKGIEKIFDQEKEPESRHPL